MCTPTPPKDTSAQQAAAAEATRQANVTAGQKNIDSAFSQYDAPFYDNYTKAYEDNYNPQVDEQYNNAAQKQTYASARNGVLNSTPAITDQDRLADSYASARQTVAGDANTATQNLQSQVAGQKSNLYALNESAADPTEAAANAAAASGTIPTTPQYSSLGDLFSGLVNSGTAYLAGQQKNNLQGYTPQAFSPGGGLPSASGSGSVVG